MSTKQATVVAPGTCSGIVRQGESVNPLGSRGELHPMSSLAGADRHPDGEMGLPRSRPQEDDVLLGSHEVESTQMGDYLAL